MDYGLIGERLGHSYSPQIHALLGNDRYELRPIPPEELDAFLRARDFKGLNVTIPYKQAVLPYCAELRDTARENGIAVDGLTFVHAPDVIRMEDHPKSILREKKDCSMAVALRLLADGEGDAVADVIDIPRRG